MILTWLTEVRFVLCYAFTFRKMANRRSSKRSYLEFLDGNDDGDSKVYRFQILLPNGASVRLIFNDLGEDMFLDEFIHIIRKELEKTAETTTKASRKIFWNGNIYLEDMSDNKIRKKISFSHFRTNKCHILRLHVCMLDIALSAMLVQSDLFLLT